MIQQMLATSCEELTHWKRLWIWEGFGAGGKGDDRGCDGWIASPTQWMWVWVNSGSWWWTARPGVLHFMGCKELDMTERLNWTELKLSSGKEPACQCRRLKRRGFRLWVRRSPGEGNGNPLQNSCLENSMYWGAWQATVHRVAQSWTLLKQLSILHTQDYISQSFLNILLYKFNFSILIIWRLNHDLSCNSYSLNLSFK